MATKSLTAEINKILKDYEDDVIRNVEEISKKIAQKGAKKLSAASKKAVGGTGKYAKGWGVTEEKTRLGSSAVIHHKTMPGLPHLLEHGHIAVVNGQRVGQAQPHQHILPIEEELVSEFEKEVIAKL